METTDRPSAYAFADGHPSSPPMTPGSRTHARYPPQTSHTSPIYRRMGLSRLAQSPPLEFIEPIGQGHSFRFTRPQSREASSRPSTPSERACATTPQDSEDDVESNEDDDESNEDDDGSTGDDGESDEGSAREDVRPARRVEGADISFVLEYLDSDPGYDSDVEVVQPNQIEDAKSDKSGSIVDRFKDIQLEEESSSDDEQQRIYRKKKKRWSAGIFKRSHSQSVEGDSSYSDNDPLDDVNSASRRLRRRLRGPSDRRASLVFEDRGFSNANNIVEVEEPEEGGILHSKGPPSIPSDDAFTLDELPFWSVEESMDVETDSS